MNNPDQNGVVQGENGHLRPISQCFVDALRKQGQIKNNQCGIADLQQNAFDKKVLFVDVLNRSVGVFLVFDVRKSNGEGLGAKLLITQIEKKKDAHHANGAVKSFGCRDDDAQTGDACLIGIILGGVFLNHEDRESVALVENNPEQVVNEKVMLVLSDGQTIGLAHQGTDSIYIGQATIIKKENQLAYQRRQDTLGTRVEEERNRIITTVGGDYCFILSDGTKVWLNAESELDFPVDFVGKERVVRLKGEAYFEVKPDAAHPFIVETRGVRTRVLGTSFNIKAYDNEESIFTTLLTGKVKVSAIGEENESVVLTPGMQSEWQENGQKMSVKKVNAENFTAWRQGAFMFDNENIMVVTRVLERWYGLKFIYNENVHEHTFSGRLSKDEPLESILETLTFTGGPQFKIEKDVVYIIEKK